MDIINLDQIKKIGMEYGWEPRRVELALESAIYLCYAEKEMLVEVDVNLEHGTIAARRRNGVGDRGSWIDINNPLLPSMKMFREVMELQEWGDGAPGRVLEGTVAGFRDGNIIYRVFDNMIIIPENLLSVLDFHARPALGTKQVLCLCSTQDRSGFRVGTRRGKEFVSAVMESYYPGCVSGIWMGASNSWAVIRMRPEHMSAWLEQGGVNIKHLQQVLGLRRITLLPEGKGETEQECRDNEIRHFVNNAWKACRITEMTEDKIAINTPVDATDPRKLRTFTSMLEKLAPERQQIIN